MGRIVRKAAALPPWVVHAVILVGTAFAAEPGDAIAPLHVKIEAETCLVVNRAQQLTATKSGLTLQAALEQAARDPRDNTIVLDPRILGSDGLVLDAADPLTFTPPAVSGTGRDSLEAPGGPTLMVRAAPSAVAALLVRRGTLTIRNVVFQGGSERAVIVSDGAQVVLEQCDVNGSRGAGLVVTGGSRVEILGGRIHDHGAHGIELYGDSEVIVRDVTLHGNRQAGLAVFGRSVATVERSRIQSSGQWGIVATNEARVDVRAAAVKTSGFANIDATERASVSMDSCDVSGGGRFGVLATRNAHVALRRSTIEDSGSRGLEVQDSATAELYACRVERNGNFGAVLFGRSSARIEGGVFRGNRGHGLAVRDEAAADVRDCLFEKNQYSGVGAPDAADGGRLSARRCIFRGNGLRPVFRGPMHIDPPVPTVIRIVGSRVVAGAAPRAAIDLYADRAGEAALYLRTVFADGDGRFELSLDEVPPGEVITAAATTVDGHTSEFNVVAGRMEPAVLAALLARTGPLSDTAGAIEGEAAVQRWRPGERVVFAFADQPEPHVAAYVRWFLGRAAEWTDGRITLEARYAAVGIPLDVKAVMVPVRLVSRDEEAVAGTGGTTYTQWDSLGYFTGSVRILLTRPVPGEPVCPRVVIHEMCHALGLYHARIGLLSRMQGIPAPAEEYVNDFAPAPTFFDVAALQVLYQEGIDRPTTLAGLTARGLLPSLRGVAGRVVNASGGRGIHVGAEGAGALSAPPANPP